MTRIGTRCASQLVSQFEWAWSRLETESEVTSSLADLGTKQDMSLLFYGSLCVRMWEHGHPKISGRLFNRSVCVLISEPLGNVQLVS